MVAVYKRGRNIGARNTKKEVRNTKLVTKIIKTKWRGDREKEMNPGEHLRVGKIGLGNRFIVCVVLMIGNYPFLQRLL